MSWEEKKLRFNLIALMEVVRLASDPSRLLPSLSLIRVSGIDILVYAFGSQHQSLTEKVGEIVNGVLIYFYTEKMCSSGCLWPVKYCPR